MLDLTINIKGHTESDLEFALEEVKRMISQGFQSGRNSNSTGKFNFHSRSGGWCAKNPDHLKLNP